MIMQTKGLPQDAWSGAGVRRPGGRSFPLPLRNSGETPDEPKTLQTHPDAKVVYLIEEVGFFNWEV
jgi:hypothetical protein